MTAIQVKISPFMIVCAKSNANNTKLRITAITNKKRLAPVCFTKRKCPTLTIACTSKNAKLVISPTDDNGKMTTKIQTNKLVKNSPVFHQSESLLQI